MMYFILKIKMIRAKLIHKNKCLNCRLVITLEDGIWIHATNKSSFCDRRRIATPRGKYESKS